MNRMKEYSKAVRESLLTPPNDPLAKERFDKFMTLDRELRMDGLLPMTAEAKRDLGIE